MNSQSYEAVVEQAVQERITYISKTLEAIWDGDVMTDNVIKTSNRLAIERSHLEGFLYLN